MSDSQSERRSSIFGQVCYLIDPNAHEEANRGGEKYWHASLPEVLDGVGVRGQAVKPRGMEALLDEEGAGEVLILGAGDVPGGDQNIREALVHEALERWVASEGILIGTMTGGSCALTGVS